MHDDAKLLIVDDEVSTRTLLTEILIEHGYSVRSAGDGFSALHEIRREMPDLIVSDLCMPGMSGFELLSVVRRRFPSIKLIAMSVSLPSTTATPVLAVDGFFEKGSHLDSLLKIIEDMIYMKDMPSIGSQCTYKPSWIPMNGHNPEGAALVIITCPECLRTSPLVLAKAVSPVRETVCVHCSSVIRYAIVQSTSPAPPQDLDWKPVVGTPGPLSLFLLN